MLPNTVVRHMHMYMYMYVHTLCEYYQYLPTEVLVQYWQILEYTCKQSLVVSQVHFIVIHIIYIYMSMYLQLHFSELSIVP